MPSVPLIIPIDTGVPVTQEAPSIDTDHVEMALEIALLDVNGNTIPGAFLKLQATHGENAAIDIELTSIATSLAQFRGFIA